MSQNLSSAAVVIGALKVRGQENFILRKSDHSFSQRTSDYQVVGIEKDGNPESTYSWNTNEVLKFVVCCSRDWCFKG